MKRAKVLWAATAVAILCGCGSDPGAGGTQNYPNRDERPFAKMEPADLPADKWTEAETAQLSIKLPKEWQSFDLMQEGISDVLFEAEKSNPEFEGLTLTLMAQRDTGGMVLFSTSPKRVEGYADNASVIVFDAPEGASMDDIIQMNKEVVSSLAAGTMEYAEMQPPAGKFGRIEFAQMQKDQEGKEMKLARWTYVAKLNGKVVTVNYASLYSRAAEMEKIADSSITSLKMK